MDITPAQFTDAAGPAAPDRDAALGLLVGNGVCDGIAIERPQPFAAADRAVAKKYLLTVLERSSATLKAIATTLPELEGFETQGHAPQHLAGSSDARHSPAGRA